MIRGERAVDRDALFATLRAQAPVFFSERLDAPSAYITGQTVAVDGGWTAYGLYAKEE